MISEYLPIGCVYRWWTDLRNEEAEEILSEMMAKRIHAIDNAMNHLMEALKL